MQSVASILDRFRRPAGVPAAAAEDIAAELTPVFAALEELEEEAKTIRDDAAREAEQLLAAAEARSAEILAAWGQRAQAEGARMESDCERAAATQVEAAEAAGREQAQRLRERGHRRMPGLVAEVVACVKEAAR
jgi:hypothetical protein